jgi:hypothetical protein
MIVIKSIGNTLKKLQEKQIIDLIRFFILTNAFFLFNNKGDRILSLALGLTGNGSLKQREFDVYLSKRFFNLLLPKLKNRGDAGRRSFVGGGIGGRRFGLNSFMTSGSSILVIV